jgi:general secretion pathway protein K
VRTELGLALVLVLWALVLLTTVGLSFGFAARVETAAGTALGDEVRAEAVAAAGVRRAMVALLAEDQDQRWPLDASVREIPWPESRLQVSVRAESAKIDLNHAAPELLLGLFTNLLPEADAGALVDAVLARREQIGRQPSAGLERRDYRSAARAAGSSRQAFATVDELTRLPGFDPVNVQRLRPYLTVHGGKAKVDATSADVEVLAAVPGVTRAAAEAFVRDRAGSTAGKRDLDLSLLGGGVGFLDASPKSPVANVRALARLEGGAAAMVEAVVRLGGAGKPFELLDWRRSAFGVEGIVD